MNLSFQKDDGEDVLPEGAKNALESYPHIQPEASFNRAVLQSLDLEKMRRRSTLVGRMEEFLGLGLWQFASTSALGAILPAVVLGSMLVSSQEPSSQSSLPEPMPDPLNLNFYGPLYAREIFKNHARATKTSLVMPLRTGELCLDLKFPMA